MLRSEAVVDLSAITANVRTLAAGTSAEIMAVVKADGYGHGMVPSARAAVAGGASWLGVAMLEEALALRAADIQLPILAWLWTPHDHSLLREALSRSVDVSVSSHAALDMVVTLAAELGVTARIHLKVDTGLSRNGATPADWPDLVIAAARAASNGVLEIVGIWSHLVSAELPGDPITAHQLDSFREALETAEDLGVIPRLRHIANSAGLLVAGGADFDLVRTGIAIYGLSPAPALGSFGLTPAMTLRSHVANVKRVGPGQGVSYNHVYRTKRETTLALVPLGYADGIPIKATNVAPVAIQGCGYRVCGRVAMDQFVVDVGDAEIYEGDEVILFGPGSDGEPTAQDWADALDTIHYEVVTRIGVRVPRSYVGYVGAQG
ncbi:MAG: alanine racemase [Pseudonocardiales bacterium]|jgi:alanine racemase|nr:alanine racemase [Pseudonocardiales bacterium]